MDRRAAWQEAIVGGTTGLMVVAMFIVARSLSGASDSDFLSFAGALLGSAITVAGSVYVLQWQQNSEKREERALLLELLDDVDNACEPFQLANQAALKARYSTTAAKQVAEVQAAIQRVHEFRLQMRPRTASMMRASSVLASLAYEDSELRGALGGIAMYPDMSDFGFLNQLAHEAMGKTRAAREVLKA